MITKINYNGETRLAIVLDEYDQLPDVQDFTNSILSLIAYSRHEEPISANTLYDAVSLVLRMQLTADQCCDIWFNRPGVLEEKGGAK